MTLRLGLCCQFLDSPIRFRTATHRYVSTLSRPARRTYLAAIAADNAIALAAAVERCAELGIGAFRINSQMLPLGTHPVSGYALESLDRSGAILSAFASARPTRSRRRAREARRPDTGLTMKAQRSARAEIEASTPALIRTSRGRVGSTPPRRASRENAR